MRGTVRLYVRRTAGASLLTMAACSSTETAPPSCAPYVSDASLASPVLFSADIVPIFQTNCATAGGTCHGDPDSYPRLGAVDGGIDAAVVLGSIVGMTSAEDPTMAFVTAGDPEHSYLMHKLDGDQCTLASECAASMFSDDFPNCGSTMPFLSPRLPDGTRDEVRAWIQQGAQGD